MKKAAQTRKQGPTGSETTLKKEEKSSTERVRLLTSEAI
jgi:hypothetical protein